MQPSSLYGEWLDNNLVQLHDLKIPEQKGTGTYKGRTCKTSESFRLYLRRL